MIARIASPQSTLHLRPVWRFARLWDVKLSAEQPRVSIIIPTWNRRDLVMACLESLSGQTFSEAETIVVDDASSDDTVEVVGRAYPEAKIQRLPENRRFAAAVNSGIRRARGEWVFLLNNDVTMAPDALERLVEAAETQDADMAGPLILWRGNPDTIYSAGDRIGVNGRPESIGFREPLAGFVFPDTVFGVSAAAGLYRKSLFDRVGLLDERFVAYFEDSDFCFRARLAGARAVLAPGAVAYHIGSASIEGQTWWRSAQCFRNHALLVIKNMPWPLLAKYWPRIARERLHQGSCLFSSARAAFGASGALGVLAQTVLSLVRAIPHALAERRPIQRARVLSVRELDDLLRAGRKP